ncbi:hypothetical protein GDO81_028395 [Engystomops pustulosus]|uniref:Uncharacterized protein n=1 Tax=Engystomops pustulosus TaxID=76066 RepID=A0AAV6YFL9_ENGPU|nr:hypothetical protein GDO81_028395 [Engystomops pustulosus]
MVELKLGWNSQLYKLLIQCVHFIQAMVGLFIFHTDQVSWIKYGSLNKPLRWASNIPIIKYSYNNSVYSTAQPTETLVSGNGIKFIHFL